MPRVGRTCGESTWYWVPLICCIDILTFAGNDNNVNCVTKKVDHSSKKNQKFAKEVAERGQRGELRRVYLARIATEFNTVPEASRSSSEASERSATKRSRSSKRKSKRRRSQKDKQPSKDRTPTERNLLQSATRPLQTTTEDHETPPTETDNRMAEVLSQVSSTAATKNITIYGLHISINF